MFAENDLFVTIEGFNVRKRDDREADNNHMLEVRCEVPLTQEIASGISARIAKDLYELQPGGDYAPKPEIKTALFDLKTGVYIFSAREHVATAHQLVVPGVTVRKVGVKRTNAGQLVLGVTIMWTILGYETELAYVARLLKSGVYITLEKQANDQRELFDEAKQDGAPEGAEATVDQSGVVENIATRRGRKKRSNVDAEAKAQRSEGQSRSASE